MSALCFGRASEEVQREKAAQRESDEQPRWELENTDPEKFKRIVSPLSRSSKTEEE
jgi:hypothetical protein